MQQATDENIYPPVIKALDAMIKGFAEGSAAEGTAVDKAATENFDRELQAIISGAERFGHKMQEMDRLFEKFPVFGPLSEFCFDLLMVNFFASDAKKLEETYLESQEWKDIEERTLDRGSELLNLFLYLNDCRENGTPPGLDDFLREFLLTDDDLYQDEFEIYEPIIKNQQLAEADVEQVVKTADGIVDELIKEIFVPLMLFFNTDLGEKEAMADILSYSKQKANDAAVYSALMAYNNALLEME